MSWKMAVIIGSVVLLAATGGLANDKSDKDRNDLEQINQDWQDVRPSAATIVKLTHFVDLWHDATLKGRRDLVFQREQELMSIIMSDLGRSYKYLDECEEKSVHSNQERLSHPLEIDGIHQSSMEVPINPTNLQKTRSLIKAKQRIAGTISRSTAFSNKLRLFGDYQELLRRELDLERPKLAEETSDAQDNLPGE
ncbi:MAG: hypothetical protein KOO62_04565 [candidate division Zixibacteria bacterium]|nr:hypothetical protein [candidate division Zixibacteria bacterium]